MNRRGLPFVLSLMVAALLAFGPRSASARLDMDRYARLREAERYQMDVAEKLFQARKWEAARTEYEKFMKLYKDSRSVSYCQFMIAQCYQHKNLLHTAIKEYTKVTDFWTKTQDAPLAQYKIAECHWKMGEREKAVAAYNRLVERFPKSPLSIGALWYQAEYYFRIKENELAIEKLETMMANYKRDRNWWRYWDKGWDRLYWHYCYSMQPTAAVELAAKRRDKEWAPLDCAGRFRHVGRHYRNNAETRNKSKQAFDLAKHLYEEIIAEGPKGKYYSHALWEIGYVYREQGMVQEAREAFERYLTTFPKDDNRRRAYAWYLFDLKKYNEAMAQCLKCANEYTGRWEIAEMYRRRKMMEDCIGTLEAMVPNHKEKAAEIYWRIAWVYRTFHKWKEAKETYELIIGKYPQKTDDSYWELARMHHHNMGKFQEAIKYYDMSNKEPSSLFEKAECYRRQKKYEDGIKTLSMIIGFFHDKAPEAQLRVAQYFEQWGKKELAVRAYKLVCDKYPRSGQARRAHDTLEFKYKIPYTGGGVKKAKEEG